MHDPGDGAGPRPVVAPDAAVVLPELVSVEVACESVEPWTVLVSEANVVACVVDAAVVVTVPAVVVEETVEAWHMT